jgi:DNA-binding NarL/FixJ family response regulator
MIKVLIVDDHAIFRMGLKSVLHSDPEIRVVGEATDGNQATAMVVELRPDVVLMDVTMTYSGLNATVDILSKLPQTKIVILTISESSDDVIEAVRSGAKGYLLKSMAPGDLITSVKAIASGGAIITPSMAAKLLDDFRANFQKIQVVDQLTDREKEVLNLVASGASNRDIARNLYVSEPTVKSHLRNIMSKLHLKNRSQAAVYAMQNGRGEQRANALMQSG